MAEVGIDVTLATHDEDAARGAAIFGAGFEADPLMTWVFPGDGAERRTKLEVMFGWMLREVLVGRGAVYLLGDRACAAWTPPGSPHWTDEQTADFFETLSQVATADDLGRLGALDAAARAAHPEATHWYLGTLAARPEHQGTGAGTAILGACLRDVDAAGLPAYLESSNPRNVTLYLRHGFDVTGDVVIPDGPSMTAMWRPAQT